MKLTFRTINGTNFHVECEPDTPVGELKAKVEASQGAGYAKEAMKLVYKGKILDKDDSKVSEYGVEESGFLVVFMQALKAKPAAPAAPAATPAAAGPSATPATPAAPPAETPAQPAAPAKAGEAAPSPAAPATAAPASAAAAAAAIESAASPLDYSSAASALLSGGALEATVVNICEMGFERSQVMLAMRAAYNNPDRAIEYLMSGIPAGAGPHAPPQPAAGGAPATGGALAAAPAAGGAAAGAAAAPQPFNMFGGAASGGAAAAPGPLDFLRTMPQFQLLRRAVQANPQILVTMLQELGKQNPALLQIINSNQQEFMRLLTEAPTDEEEAAMAEALGGLGEGDEDDEMAEALAAAAGGGGVTVELTEADVQAIERLQGLGFDRNACIEAYLTCDKNEELAANFLLENAFD